MRNATEEVLEHVFPLHQGYWREDLGPLAVCRSNRRVAILKPGAVILEPRATILKPRVTILKPRAVILEPTGVFRKFRRFLRMPKSTNNEIKLLTKFVKK